MALKDFATCIQGNLVERVGELAKPASNCRNHAAFLKHTTAHVAFQRGGPADLLPEGKDLVGWNHAEVESACGDAQVLYLAALIPGFRRIGVCPEWSLRFGCGMGELGSRILRMLMRPIQGVACRAA